MPFQNLYSPPQMSAVRYFNKVPHIIRYGMHDDKKEKCWIWFWRNGVRFIIYVDGDDVKETTFYTQWRPLIYEDKRGEIPLSQWAETHWHPLCDLIISTSMPTLQQLAPDQEHWTTLRDYLHTPAYRLRLFASEDRLEILTRIQDGPIDTGAYEFQPVAKSTLPIPEVIRYYQSDELRILDKDKDWRQKPKHVAAADGREFPFLACEQGSMDSNTKERWNHSLKDIRARLETLALDARDPSRTEGPSDVCGVVMDEAVLRLVTNATLQEKEQFEGTDKSPQQLIAGILLARPKVQDDADIVGRKPS